MDSANNGKKDLMIALTSVGMIVALFIAFTIGSFFGDYSDGYNDGFKQGKVEQTAIADEKYGKLVDEYNKLVEENNAKFTKEQYSQLSNKYDVLVTDYNNLRDAALKYIGSSSAYQARTPLTCSSMTYGTTNQYSKTTCY